MPRSSSLMVFIRCGEMKKFWRRKEGMKREESRETYVLGRRADCLVLLVRMYHQENRNLVDGLTCRWQSTVHGDGARLLMLWGRDIARRLTSVW